jgi:hypothetical protein
MLKKLLLPLLMLLFVTFSPIWADESGREIFLKPVQKDTPAFTRSKDNEYGFKYSLKMVKVAGNPQITTPPATDAMVLYYSQVKLGVPAKEHGVLVDFEGKDKQIWVDSDGDGDFAEESPAQIFKSDRYPNVNVYYAPTPLTFQVEYTMTDHSYRTELQFDLPYLFIARTGREDIFYLTTRTWFYGELILDEEDIYFGLVDTNDNGLYNDPDDLIFIGRDSDLNFTQKKGAPVKKSKNLKSKAKARYLIEYGEGPEKLILKKDEK